MRRKRYDPISVPQNEVGSVMVLGAICIQLQCTEVTVLVIVSFLQRCTL